MRHWSRPWCTLMPHRPEPRWGSCAHISVVFRANSRNRWNYSLRSCPVHLLDVHILPAFLPWIRLCIPTQALLSQFQGSPFFGWRWCDGDCHYSIRDCSEHSAWRPDHRCRSCRGRGRDYASLEGGAIGAAGGLLGECRSGDGTGAVVAILKEAESVHNLREHVSTARRTAGQSAANTKPGKLKSIARVNDVMLLTAQ